jgi:hypothetical protein
MPVPYNLYYNVPTIKQNYSNQNNLFGYGNYGNQGTSMYSGDRGAAPGAQSSQLSMYSGDRGVNPDGTFQAPQDGQQGQGGFDYGKAMGYASEAAGSYAAGQAATDRFAVDGMAGYKGSAKGLASGGVVGAIIGGVAGQAGTFREVHKNLKGLNTAVNVTGYDAMGNPTYNGSGMVNARNDIRDLEKGEKAIKKSLDPATHVIGKIFGTGRKIRDKRRAMQRNIGLAQNSYNKAAETANANRLSMDSYYDSMNNQDRLYNLYNR